MLQNCLRTSVLGLACFLAAGCSPLSLNKASMWPFNDDKPKVPEKVIAVWADTVLYQPGERPVRGFGGRLMFYEGKKEKPVKVEGTLVIYAFEEDGRAPNNTKPDRKYVFQQDQLPAHYSKSDLGHSYSVWLPWDEVGGPQKEISLIIRFEPKGGAVVVSEAVRQLLPGTTNAAPAPRVPAGPAVAPQFPAGGATVPGQGQGAPVMPTAANPMPTGTAGATGPQAVQLASYEAAVPGSGDQSVTQPPRGRRMMTATIPVPSGLAAGRAPALAPVVPATPITAAQAQPQPGPQLPAPPSPPTPAQVQPLPGQPVPGGALSTGPQAQSFLSLPPRSRFVPQRSRALGEPLAQLARDRAPSLPFLAAPPCAPGAPPGSDPGNGSPAFPSGAVPGPR
jgi:hypothetical protein